MKRWSAVVILTLLQCELLVQSMWGCTMLGPDCTLVTKLSVCLGKKNGWKDRSEFARHSSRARDVKELIVIYIITYSVIEKEWSLRKMLKNERVDPCDILAIILLWYLKLFFTLHFVFGWLYNFILENLTSKNNYTIYFAIRKL